jgi:hypothetical protein
MECMTMTMTKRTIPVAVSQRATLSESRYGTARPVIELESAPGTHWRVIHAAAHVIAARVQMSTPIEEGWNVGIESRGDRWAEVYIELADGKREEAERAMALLREIAEAG